MPPLRLAVDARVIAEDTRGIGRYARAILRRLALRDDFALTLLAYGPLPQLRRGAYARALGSDNFAVAAKVAGDIDVVWHPANGTFFSSPVPSVATIHDAVPFRYPNPDEKRRAHVEEPFLRSARSASRIVAVSEFGRREVHEALGVELERIAVIPHGVEREFSPGAAAPLPRELQGQRYLLFVGNPQAEPRKNFPLLYEAYRRAWPDGDGPLLAVAAAQAPEVPGVVATGVFAGDIAGNDATLVACYRGARALALASYHETFGMPMLEAMACGTPVAASNAGSLPEVGGEAALYAPPDDAAAWAEALRRIVDDAALRRRLVAAGLERAARFTWETSVERHAEVFRAVAR
jgi:glycosyltransferase involved in cell wall biosynthesis